MSMPPRERLHEKRMYEGQNQPGASGGESKKKGVYSEIWNMQENARDRASGVLDHLRQGKRTSLCSPKGKKRKTVVQQRKGKKSLNHRIEDSSSDATMRAEGKNGESQGKKRHRMKDPSYTEGKS